MTRKIKFRVWDGEYMYYSHENKGLGYLDFLHDGTTVVGIDDGDQRFEDKPLMQFTGLEDRNGIEIFEGDIFESFGDLNCGDFPEKPVLTFWKGQFGFGTTDHGNHVPIFEIWVRGHALSVIGNIYENPELLKGEK